MKIICKDRKCIHNEYSTNGCTAKKKVIIVKGRCYSKEKGRI